MIAIERGFYAYLDDTKHITILLPYSYHNGASSKFILIKDNDKIDLQIKSKVSLENSNKYICQLNEEISFGTQYWVEDEYGGKTDLQIGAVIRTNEFDQRFFYEGPLGVIYSEEQTVFNLWAPTATGVKLKLQSPNGHSNETIVMNRGNHGEWTVTVNRNLEMFLYTYLICVNLEWKEAVDPYAVTVTANGQHGVIIDLLKTKKVKPILPPLEHAVDAIIYETHIRDFTIHPKSGIVQKGKYLGAAELDTRGENGDLTALSYVKDLGVTHIEFLPVHDFEGVDELGEKKAYNWGYNPLHFNSPEGSYSSDPANPYLRVHELKKLIHSIHSVGLRVILDVVYNHVYKLEESTFEKIVPGYFFRYNEDGFPSNGTGVGNDFASERLMGRRFIVDSIKFWLEEYQIDGFRFDLMGILDVETMKEIRKIVDEIDPSIILIGEGWDLNTPIPEAQKAFIKNQSKLPRIGQFNDQYRDSIKGNSFQLETKGYALGNPFYYEAAKELLAGSIGLVNKNKPLFTEPVQSVNYVECHDNHTLWDKLNVCELNGDGALKEKKHRLTTVMVLLSQGIPFLHSGQEFFRTKNGNGNSYCSPDSINQLDWLRKAKYIQNVEYIKGIISIRRAYRALRMPTSELIKKYMKFMPIASPLIGFQLEEVETFGKSKFILVYFNPTDHEHKVDLPIGEWCVLANEQKAASDPLFTVNGSITISPWSSYVLVSK